MSTIVLLNPVASQARKNLTRIRGMLADHEALSGAEIQVCETWDEGREAATRAAADGVERVVAAGGDGTVNSVVNGLMSVSSGRPVLGILALGTGNDLSRSLGLPDDAQKGLKLLERNRVRELDVFRVRQAGGTRYGINVSAGGFSGEVDEELSGDAKERWGPLAYLKTAIEQVRQVGDYDTVLTVDGEEIRELHLCNVAVANGRWAGGGMPVAPEALMDDGALDVVALAAVPVARLGGVMARMAAGRHLDHELITWFRARSLRIESDPPMRFNVDGELLGAGPADFEILPGALRVVVGEDADLTDEEGEDVV